METESELADENERERLCAVKSESSRPRFFDGNSSSALLPNLLIAFYVSHVDS